MFTEQVCDGNQDCVNGDDETECRKKHIHTRQPLFLPAIIRYVLYDQILLQSTIEIQKINTFCIRSNDKSTTYINSYLPYLQTQNDVLPIVSVVISSRIPMRREKHSK